MQAAPRLAPIDRAPTLGVWLFSWFFRRLLGKVMMPARVIYTRMPRLLWPQLLLYRLAARGLSLPPLLVHRVMIRVSLRHGCAFCTDIHQAMAVREGYEARSCVLPLEREGDLPLGSAERAALAYVDAMCAGGRVDDATFEGLRGHWNERQIVELTWLAAFTTYLNRMASALGIGSDDFCGALDQASAGGGAASRDLR
jgi:AhpD family alkylhydroperoxidase